MPIWGIWTPNFYTPLNWLPIKISLLLIRLGHEYDKNNLISRVYQCNDGGMVVIDNYCVMCEVSFWVTSVYT